MDAPGDIPPIRSLRYTEKALADLKAASSWLTQPGAGQAARRKMLALRAAIRRLREQPCLYAIGRHPGVRELPCDGGYQALYRVIPDTGRNDTAGNVLVLRVFGPGQDRSAL